MSRKVLGITAHFRRQDGKPELEVEKDNPDWSYSFGNSVSSLRSSFLNTLLERGVGLSSAFTWSYTPQGSPYWSSLDDSQDDDGCVILSEEDKGYIRYLIREHT